MTKRPTKKRGRFPGDIWFRQNVEDRMQKTLRKQQAHENMCDATIEGLRGTVWYKEEFQKHAKLFKEERKIQAEKRAAHSRAAALNGQAEKVALVERDKVWTVEHEGDSDDELLDYVRQCAAELGHTPMRREVLGSTYISERFGNWAVALTIAELPLPRGMKPPKQTALNAYLKQRNRADAAMTKEG